MPTWGKKTSSDAAEDKEKSDVEVFRIGNLRAVITTGNQHQAMV